MDFSTPISTKKYSFAEYMAKVEASKERHDFYYGELLLWPELPPSTSRFVRILIFP